MTVGQLQSADHDPSIGQEKAKHKSLTGSQALGQYSPSRKPGR